MLVPAAGIACNDARLEMLWQILSGVPALVWSRCQICCNRDIGYAFLFKKIVFSQTYDLI